MKCMENRMTTASQVCKMNCVELLYRHHGDSRKLPSYFKINKPVEKKQAIKGNDQCCSVCNCTDCFKAV